jgi:hypothetical protein
MGGLGDRPCPCRAFRRYEPDAQPDFARFIGTVDGNNIVCVSLNGGHWRDIYVPDGTTEIYRLSDNVTLGVVQVGDQITIPHHLIGV